MNTLDDGYTISNVSSDSQHALPFLDNDVNNPPVDTLITLQASIIDADGNAAPAGIDVWWQCPDYQDNRVLFWPPNTKGKPGAVQYITGRSQTDANGIATIFNSATVNMIFKVYAYLAEPSEKTEVSSEEIEVNDEPLEGPLMSGNTYQGNTYQSVSYVTFSDTDAVLTQPILDTDGGLITVEDVDGSDPDPDPQYGPVGAQVPLAIIGNDPPKDGSTTYVVWACAADDTTERGQLIQDIKTWKGKDISLDMSYGIFAQNEGTQANRKNKVAYFMYSRGTSYQSQVNAFGFKGVPLVRPDDLPIYTNSSLNPVMLDSGVDGSDANARHKVISMPDHRALTYNDLDKSRYLWFAIPAPTDAEGQDNYSDNDVIKATIWLNGWLPNGDVLQTDILNFPTKYGKDFKKNYGTDGKTYLPIFIPYTNLADFCQGPQGPGYMWIMYTYNGLNSMLPIQNGSYPARINFTKPPSGNLERK
ncbi:hypothetical protein M1D80_00545 (plasmid) [Phyllobacteriaceae bacterium JZ32]